MFLSKSPFNSNHSILVVLSFSVKTIFEKNRISILTKAHVKSLGTVYFVAISASIITKLAHRYRD